MENRNVISIDGIDCYEKDGTAYLKLETVARGLGFVSREVKNGVEYESVRWTTVNKYLEEIGFCNKLQKDDFIPENVFYRLAMKAKNAAAEAFQAKIADEVIPSIRKHGAYITEDVMESMIASPDFTIRMLTKLKEEQDKRKMLEAKIEEEKPLTDFAKTVSDSLDAVTIGEYAKILFDRDGINIGRNRLYKWLRNHGYLMKHNEPYQTYITDGTFVSILTGKANKLYPITLVTGKGMVRLFPEIADWWDRNHKSKRRSPLELDAINRYILEAKKKGHSERRIASELGTISNIAVHKRIVNLRKIGLLST